MFFSSVRSAAHLVLRPWLWLASMAHAGLLTLGLASVVRRLWPRREQHGGRSAPHHSPSCLLSEPMGPIDLLRTLVLAMFVFPWRLAAILWLYGSMGVFAVASRILACSSRPPTGWSRRVLSALATMAARVALFTAGFYHIRQLGTIEVRRTSRSQMLDAGTQPYRFWCRGEMAQQLLLGRTICRHRYRSVSRAIKRLRISAPHSTCRPMRTHLSSFSPRISMRWSSSASGCCRMSTNCT